MERRRIRTEAAASVLGVAPATLDAWRRRGTGPPFYRVNSVVIYDRSELEDWLATRRVIPAEKAIAGDGGPRL